MKENEEEKEVGCTSNCATCGGCAPDMDFGEPTITLVDDEGKETEFEILDVIVLEDEKQYLVVTEAGKETDEPEAIILEIKEDGGEEVYDTVTDEKIAEKVFNMYVSQFDDEEEKED